MREDTRQMIAIQRGTDHLREKAVAALGAALANHELGKAQPQLADTADALASAYGRAYELFVEAGMAFATEGRSKAFEKLLKDIDQQLAEITDANLDLWKAGRDSETIATDAE